MVGQTARIYNGCSAWWARTRPNLKPNLYNKVLEPLLLQKVDSHQLIPCYKRSHTKELLVRAKKATTHAVQPVENKHKLIEHNQKFYSANMLLIMLKCQKWTFYLPVQSDKFHSKHPSEATKSSLQLKNFRPRTPLNIPLSYSPPPSPLCCSALRFASLHDHWH